MYYAEIENGKVKQVLVIDDSWPEAQAQDFLSGISLNLWVKTDITGSIGGKYAGIGDEFHPELGNLFIRKPFDSWVLDPERKMFLPPWPAPIAIPVGYIYQWS